MLSARMIAIREPRMRMAALGEAMAAEPPYALVALIGHLVALGGDASPGAVATLDAVLRVLSDPAALGYERRAELYGAALDAGRPEVALLFLDVAPATPGTAQLERKLDDERPLTPAGRSMTLGERKWLARGHRRDLIMQLARDPHPDVIAILLDNPHLTEGDVLKLASRRPMLPRALAVIAASEKWRVRPNVRRALVLNPYTPAPLAARLMTLLADADLARAAADPALSDRLRQHAAELVARRRAVRSLLG